MEKDNSLQVVNCAFRSYATPVTVSGGVLGAFADHTYVYATAGAGGAAYNCTCYGGIIIPTPIDVPNMTVPGDMRSVSCMINMQHTLKPNYNGWLDNCGIIYGLEGVCHNMANRILMQAGGAVMPFGTVNGYTMSFLLYGYFGDTKIPYLLRAVIAHGIAFFSGLGSENSRSGDPVFDLAQFEKIISDVENSVNAQGEDFIKSLLKMELYGVSTPENRLSALYQHYVLKDDTSKLQDDIRLKKLMNVLNDFVETKEKLFAGDDKHTPTEEEEYERIIQLNEEFVHFNRKMEDTLGSDYTALFHCTYNKDFCLFEYPSFN